VPGYCIFQTVVSTVVFIRFLSFQVLCNFCSFCQLHLSDPLFWSLIERIYTFYFLSPSFLFFHVSQVWIRHILLCRGFIFHFLLKYCTVWRGSSVVIVTRLWNGYLRIRGSIPDSQKGFLSIVHHIEHKNPSPHWNETRDPFRGDKWALNLNTLLHLI